MNQALVDKIVAAVLYEGYILYPYRPSVKNAHRWTFGGIYPQAFSRQEQGTEPCLMQTQCLIEGASPRVRIRIRFLHLTERQVFAIEDGAPRPVNSLTVNGQLYQTWQEAIERDLDLGEFSIGDLQAAKVARSFSFPADTQTESQNESDGREAARIARRQEQVDGLVEFSAESALPGVHRLTVRITNQSQVSAAAEKPIARDEALLRSFVSTHTILTAVSGKFVSLTDPPAEFRDAAEACKNVGCWPVLVGEAGETDTLLSSPIILADYPQVAAESPGDLFDATEIDEILTLRILTLTDEEKRQAAAIDPRGRAMLARTEALAREQLMNLHGAVRGLRPVSSGETRDRLEARPTKGDSAGQATRAAGVVSSEETRDRLEARPTKGDSAGQATRAAGVVSSEETRDRLEARPTKGDSAGQATRAAGVVSSEETRDRLEACPTKGDSAGQATRAVGAVSSEEGRDRLEACPTQNDSVGQASSLSLSGVVPWDPLAEHNELQKILSAGIELKPGDRVRLRPRPGGDIFDIALAGKTATIASIEQDFENRIHLAVTIDDDPGNDLGASGKPGHRFFFSPEEVEVLPSQPAERRGS